MVPSTNHAAALSLRLYRALARAFPLAELWRDVRYGLRSLGASPGFTIVALVSLSLGMAVATSTFGEVNGFLFRDVPGVAKPDELVVLQQPISNPHYARYGVRSDLFSGTAAYMAPVPFGVQLGGHTERTWGNLVTASYFPTLGVNPVLGRAFGQEDEQPGRAPIVVVSYRFWRNYLGSDRSIVGRTLRVNGQPCTIVGVGPQSFQGASPMFYGADLWLPLSVGARVAPELARDVLERYDQAILHFVARLRPGVAASRAEAALDAIARQLEREYNDPERNRPGRRATLLPGGKLVPIPKRDLPVLMSFFIVLGGMILLIAGSNVANMMLARAADRRKEIAVRLALGASRGRLIRQLLTESMLIAAGAGALGFLTASWVMRLASRMPIQYPMPISARVEPDGRVLLFTLGLTALTALAFGLAPALRATRSDLTPALKEGGAARSRKYRRLNMRNGLMLSQVVASLALLLITGFLVIGHQKLAGSPVGFDPRGLYLISLDPVRDGYSGSAATTMFRNLLERVKRLPGVTSASLTNSVPMSMIGKPEAAFWVAGPNGSKVSHRARMAAVGREFFDTLGIQVLRGRSFRQEDAADGSMAAIVNEKMAQDCWPGEDPLGRRFLEDTHAYQVVGVAKNVRDGINMVDSDAPAVIYIPLRPSDYGRATLHGITLMVRAVPGVDGAGAARREIAAIDGRLTPFNTRGMPEQIDQLMFPVRVMLFAYSFIGVFGLILASVGLAGVTAYAVAQRRREIGIRVALGARGADVLGLVMREGAALVALGTAIGMALAWAGMRGLSAALAGVARTTRTSTSDPVLLIGAPLLLATVALVACYLPARQSLRVDPVVALRQE